MKKITILGWYDKENTGDESYKTSISSLFPHCRTVFTNCIRKEHLDSDAFILGGGAVMEPPFLNQLDGLNNKFILSVTANTTADPEKLKTFKRIWVRDIKSHAVLQKIGIESDLVPDFAFLLGANRQSGHDFVAQKFKEVSAHLYTKIVTIVYNAHLAVIPSDRNLARDETTFFKNTNDLASIIDNTNASFVFIPFGQRAPWDDRITNSWLSSRCKFWDKNIVIYDKINFQQTLDIIACSDAVISTRLHASIFSCVAGVPFVDITHHDKNMGFLATIGKENWSVPYWRFDYDKCKKTLDRFLDNPEPHSIELLALSERQRTEIREAIQNAHIV
jgi:polysaccharide pyruvyl transferase WcaK-like protein